MSAEDDRTGTSHEKGQDAIYVQPTEKHYAYVLAKPVVADLY